MMDNRDRDTNLMTFTAKSGFAVSNSQNLIILGHHAHINLEINASAIFQDSIFVFRK